MLRIKTQVLELVERKRGKYTIGRTVKFNGDHPKYIRVRVVTVGEGDFKLKPSRNCTEYLTLGGNLSTSFFISGKDTFFIEASSYKPGRIYISYEE